MATKTEIDLKPFCLPDVSPTRYELLKVPFVRDGFRYATDGRIAVRIAAVGEANTDGKSPNCGEVFGPIDFSAGFAPLPVEYERKQNGEGNCHACDGMGETSDESVPLQKIKCDECDGTGGTECRTCGHEDYCDECDGKGSWDARPCPVCDGEGTETRYRAVFDGVGFDAHYLRLIAALPNPEYAISKGMMAFRFTGGEGLLMELLEN